MTCLRLILILVGRYAPPYHTPYHFVCHRPPPTTPPTTATWLTFIDPLRTFQHSHSTQLLDLVEDGITSFAHRLMRVGGVARRYWVLLSAQAAAQSKTFPERAAEFDRVNAEKIGNIMYKMLSLQAQPLDNSAVSSASKV